ncbi:hypothetical protein QC760_003768 [Botrytis cinerea]
MSFYDGHLSSITRLSKHGLRFWLQSQISSLANGPFLVICCVRKFNVCLIKHDDPVTLYPISVAWSFRPSLQLAQRNATGMQIYQLILIGLEIFGKLCHYGNSGRAVRITLSRQQ